MSELEKHVETLAKKAADTDIPQSALHFSQAALNLANAVMGLTHMKNQKPADK